VSEQLNHSCAICGEKYHFCKDCSDATSFTPWRTIVDSVEHYKIYLIIHDYTNKHIDKSEAKRLLNERDLVELDNFVTEIQSVIKDILSYEEVKINNTQFSKTNKKK